MTDGRAQMIQTLDLAGHLVALRLRGEDRVLDVVDAGDNPVTDPDAGLGGSVISPRPGSVSGTASPERIDCVTHASDDCRQR